MHNGIFRTAEASSNSEHSTLTHNSKGYMLKREYDHTNGHGRET